jgi:peptidoglycan hydrolase CwlO-like protein
MKTIKKYWLLLVAAITGLVATMFMKNRSNRKLEKTDAEIKQNDAEINNLQGRITEIEIQRETSTVQVQQHQEKIDELKEQLTTIQPEVLDVVDAKQNIVNKTKRGRKPKNKTA